MPFIKDRLIFKSFSIFSKVYIYWTAAMCQALCFIFYLYCQCLIESSYWSCLICILSSFYRWGYWGLGKWGNNMPRITYKKWQRGQNWNWQKWQRGQNSDFRTGTFITPGFLQTVSQSYLITKKRCLRKFVIVLSLFSFSPPIIEY